MTTAILGVGNIGKAVARLLVNGGERVILAERNQSHAEAYAKDVGKLASAAPVSKAITDTDVVMLAVWFDTIKELVIEHADLLKGKVVVDPSNPIRPGADGKFVRTLAGRTCSYGRRCDRSSEASYQRVPERRKQRRDRAKLNALLDTRPGMCACPSQQEHGRQHSAGCDERARQIVE